MRIRDWRREATITAVAAAGAFLCCEVGCGDSSSCERTGCNAVAIPAADDGQTSIAGVVAVEQDVSINGCAFCPLSSETLSLWPVSEPVTDNASAKSVVKGGPAAITVQASPRYQQTLDPGSYLLCVRWFCVSIDVLAGHVTPVNVLNMLGPPRFNVFDPITHALQIPFPLRTNI